MYFLNLTSLKGLIPFEFSCRYAYVKFLPWYEDKKNFFKTTILFKLQEYMEFLIVKKKPLKIKKAKILYSPLEIVKPHIIIQYQGNSFTLVKL